MAAQTVISEATLGGFARKENAWKIISDIKRYSKIMDNVDDVSIIEQSDTEGKSEWNITVEDAPLNWIEKDYFIHNEFKFNFESLDGDFDLIKGSWSVQDSEKGGIKIKFKISYDLGIPVIEEVLGDILQEKMMGNINSMLLAVKAELAPTMIDERIHNRLPINQFVTIHSGDKPYRVKIKDISKFGMKISLHETFKSTDGSIQIGKTKIEVAEMKTFVTENYSRILFAYELNEEKFSELAGSLSGTQLEKKPDILHSKPA